MKKVYLYSALIFLVGISLIGWEFYKVNNDIITDHRYFKSSFDYTTAEKNDVCIIKITDDSLRYFKVEGLTNDHRLCIRYGNTPSSIPIDKMESIIFSSDGREINTSQRWVSDLYKDSQGWQKNVAVITQDEIIDITSKNKVYYYKRPMRIGSLPETNLIIPLISVMIICIYLLIMIILMVNKILSKKSNFIVYLSLIILAVFVAWFFTDHWFTKLFNIFLGKNLVTFFLLFWIIMKINEKTKTFDFAKKELLKFVAIVLYGLVAEFFGGHICNYLYFDLFEYKGGFFYEFGNNANILGWFKFWIYFAVTNFMSNLTTYIFELRKKEKIFTQQKNEDTISSSSLASIQSRINPHFLYNALNSIASLAHTEPQKTEEMALELARFYEKCTDKKADLLIPLRDELSILDSYLKIEKIRFGDRLQVSLPTDEDIMDYLVPSFILQPIVENAIKYGYHSHENFIKIRISASTESDILTIRIYDSGPPFSENLQSGYGLDSIHKKLKFLFPDRHAISFVNQPEKCVEIVLYQKTNII